MRATEMIKGMSYIDYGERLKLLRLPTLSYQRARGPLRYNFLATTPNCQTCAMSEQDVEIVPQAD